MRRCPKCSATYDEILNFCKACGAMLDTIAEEPLRAADRRKADEKSDTIASPADSKHSPAGNTKPAASFDGPGRQCSKCGSSKMIPDIHVLVHTSEGNPKVSAFIDADPDALIFKDRLYGEFFADICGDCGHVDLKVLNPHSLFSHYLQSKKGKMS